MPKSVAVLIAKLPRPLAPSANAPRKPESPAFRRAGEPRARARGDAAGDRANREALPREALERALALDEVSGDEAGCVAERTARRADRDREQDAPTPPVATMSAPTATPIATAMTTLTTNETTFCHQCLGTEAAAFSACASDVGALLARDGLVELALAAVDERLHLALQRGRLVRTRSSRAR